MAIPKELQDATFLRDELELPYACTDVKITGQSRWSIFKEGIFEYKGKFYCIGWAEGSTEMQDEEPWKYESPKPVEVELKEITVKRWVPVFPDKKD